MNEISSDIELAPSMQRRLFRLFLGISLILFFIFGIGPLLDKAPYIRPMVQFIEEREIDATALYYTEIEEFSEAEINMRNSMDYAPRKL
jgi:hypothetical protein